MPTDALKQYDHTNSLVYFPKTLFQSLHRGHTTMKEKSVWFLGWFAALLACFRWFRPLSCRYVRPWDMCTCDRCQQEQDWQNWVSL